MKKFIWFPILAIIIAGLYGTMYMQHARTVISSSESFAPTANIQVRAQNAAVRVVQTEANNVSVQQTANVKYAVRKSTNTRNTRTIRQGQTHLSLLDHLFSTTINITVRVPRTYRGNLTVVTTNGAISFNQLHARTLHARTQSGALHGSVSVKKLTARAESGAIGLTATGLQQDSRVQAASGAVNLQLLDNGIRHVNAKADSGEVSLANLPQIKRIDEHHVTSGPAHGTQLTVTTQSGAIHIH